MTVHPTADPVTVLVADGHAVVRAGVRALLRDEPDLEIVGEATTFAAAWRLADRRRPRVLLLDPGLTGSTAGALGELHASFPDLPIVVLADTTDPQAAREALRRGAAGFVGPDAPEAELAVALRGVAHGQRYADPWLAAQLLDAPSEDPDGLSPEDRRLLTMIALGHTNREIAAAAFLSVRTVEARRSGLLRRLALRSRPEVVAYALRRGLVGDGEHVGP